jgi:hypothetical protein
MVYQIVFFPAHIFSSYSVGFIINIHILVYNFKLKQFKISKLIMDRRSSRNMCKEGEKKTRRKKKKIEKADPTAKN